MQKRFEVSFGTPTKWDVFALARMNIYMLPKYVARKHQSVVLFVLQDMKSLDNVNSLSVVSPHNKSRHIIGKATYICNILI